MARSRSRGKTAGTGRQARATSRRKAAPAATTEAEVVEEAAGLGMEGAVAIVTSVALFVGLLFLDYELSKFPGHGLFF